MRLMCAHCATLHDRDQFVIKRAEGKLYGGGRLFQAEHRRCHKITYLPEQMVRTARLVKV